MGYLQIAGCLSAEAPQATVSLVDGVQIDIENDGPTEEEKKQFAKLMADGGSHFAVKETTVTTDFKGNDYTLMEFGLIKYENDWDTIKALDPGLPWQLEHDNGACAPNPENNPGREYGHYKFHAKGILDWQGGYFGGQRVYFEYLGFNVQRPDFAFHAKTNAEYQNWSFNGGKLFVGLRTNNPLVYINDGVITSYIPVRIEADKTCTRIYGTPGGSATIPDKEYHLPYEFDNGDYDPDRQSPEGYQDVKDPIPKPENFGGAPGEWDLGGYIGMGIS